MSRQKRLETLTLVTVHGSEIKVEYPDEIIEEFTDEMWASFAKQGLWNVGNWMEARAMFAGTHLEYVDMAKVIGFY